MTRHPSVTGRMVAQALGGRAGTAAAVPFLVLDLGRGSDPHRACCRCCRWHSGWRMTAAQAQAEHARHQVAAHSRHPARRSRLGLMVRRRPR